MRRSVRILTPLILGAATAAPSVHLPQPALPARAADIVVTEGTSMAVTVSPDGRTLAFDLQGSIWTLPATGGVARRITDGFDDARQPAWSPDGRTIAFQGYRDGDYDIWAIAPDGSGRRKLTSGIHDDREPAWSHDGSRVAFSSDREASGNYDIWTVDVRSGAAQRITINAANDEMPTWSPGDTAIAFISNRGGSGVWIISLAGGAERRHTRTGVTAGAPAWGPDGRIVHYASGGQSSRLEIDSTSLTGSENVFPFRASWASATELFYTADGKIRKRATSGPRAGSVETVEFRATLPVNPARYTRRTRDLDSRAPRPVLGIVSPAVSPDGRTIAFAALGDIWTMPIGGKPVNLTNDRHLDTEPAWSPDGARLAYSSDKGGGFLNLWIRDLRTGEDRQLTSLTTSAMGAAWSPDGSQIAFLDVDGLWRRAAVSVVDVATGATRRLRAPLFGPGTPTWSSDGRRVAVAALVPYSSRFREGTNQVMVIPVDSAAGEARTFALLPNGGSIDSRSGAGPAWSPDGSRMALINAGELVIVPVSASGEPAGPARRYATEMAHSPSWSADSRSVVYQSMDRLRIVTAASGEARAIPIDLAYSPSIPTGRIVVHAGLLVDGKTPTARSDMDVVIDANRIRRVEPHSAALHGSGTLVDASGLTVMPGLIEFHTHLQKDMGAAHYRAWLAFGVTSVRSPGGTPYEAAEDREAIDAGVRPGPRVFSTGYLMEWQRTYYKMAVAIVNARHLELELQRANALRHDLVKSYVRMPDLQQRRIVEYAHSVGIPASSHEIFPSAMIGIDGVEHTTGTSRRGYSPKVATQARSYGDVAAIIGGAEMHFTPTLALSGGWLGRMLTADPSLRDDLRFELTVPWVRSTVGGGTGRGSRGAGGAPPAGAAAAPAGGRGAGEGGGAQAGAGAAGEMVTAIARAGGRVVAGTDTPNPANLHAELMAYVAAGMSPFEALRTATVNPAAALGLDAGSIEIGKVADLLVVEGNPLIDIANARRIRRVIANGKVYELAELLASRR